MAKQTVVNTIDDYTQEPITDNNMVVPTDITIDGQRYPLDLSVASRQKFDEVIGPFIKNVSPLKESVRGRGMPQTRSAAKMDREQSRAIRDFWRQAVAAGLKFDDGNDVPPPSDRGRIPQDIIDLYNRYGGQVPATEETTDGDTDGDTEAVTEDKPKSKAKGKGKGKTDVTSPQFSNSLV